MMNKNSEKLNKINRLSDPDHIQIQKRIVDGFQELSMVTEKLGIRTRQLGWKQRNVLISHVYSDYQKHDQLTAARIEWEEVSWEYNVHRRLYNLMQEYRDLYGYFPEYVELYDQIEKIIELAGKQNEFEIAKILVKWKHKMFFIAQFKE